MAEAENLSCKWLNCPDTFTSELDMGLHVMNSHLNILDYGHFTLERRPNGSPQGTTVTSEVFRRAPAIQNPPAPVARAIRARPPPPILPPIPQPSEPSARPIRRRQKTNQDPNHRIFTDMAHMATAPIPEPTPTPAPPTRAPEAPKRGQQTPKQEVTLPRRSVTLTPGPVKMSIAARNLIVKLRRPPSSHQRLFQTDHFCVICQENCTVPCKRRHREQDLQVVADWKSQYGHLKPAKKALLAQLKSMVEQYEEAERAEGSGPSTSTRPVAVAEIKEETDAEESASDSEDQKPDLRPMVVRGPAQKISKICASLIFRIRSRSARLRADDRSNFCLNCISFGQCQKDHTAAEQRLARTWAKYYGSERITMISLVEQLEWLKSKYVKKENNSN